MSAAWIAVLLVGLVAVLVDATASQLAVPSPPTPIEAIVHATVGGVWIAAGLVAWARRPALTIGRLMVAVGFAWLLSQPYWLDPLPVTVHFALHGLVLAAALHAVLAFPTGRLETPLQRAVVGVAYLAVVGGNVVWMMFGDPFYGTCAECPDALLLIVDSPRTAEAVNDAFTVVGLLVGVATVALLIRRWRPASRPGRGVLGPVLWTGAIAGAVAVAQMIVEQILGPRASLSVVVGYAGWLALALVPLAFLVGLLRARLRRGAMTALMVELGRLPSAAEVREALARGLGDPSLQLLLWQEHSDSYIDTDGEPAVLPAENDARAVTVLAHDGQRYGALVHDRFALEDSALLEAVGVAGRMAIENARLQSELRAQLTEVRASRARIIEAGDTERRRIERDLHDGAQQRLLAVRLALHLARRRVGHDDDDAQALLAEADAELLAGLDELRSLAGGIHPAVLTDEGLQGALAALARRSQIPTELRGVPAWRLPAALESAVYFVACEALVNVTKHAQASHATITLNHSRGWLRVAVNDDGIGGADPALGSGLRGLTDRVQALDGRLKLTSQAGVGTTLLAEFPSRGPATT